MDLHVRLDGPGDLAGQIYRQVRAMILDGRLPPGQALPASRDLAARLAVSRNTVGVAYDRLAAEGFVVGRVGAGTYVNAALPPPRPPQAVRGAPIRPRAGWAGLPVPGDLSAPDARYDLRAGMPDPRLFPYQTWRRLMADEVRGAAVGSGAYWPGRTRPLLALQTRRRDSYRRRMRTRAKTLTAAFLTVAAATATIAAVPAGAAPAPDNRGRDARCAHQLTTANQAFDRAFFGRDVDAFIDFYADDATIIYFNGTRPYSKEEARANSTALFTQEWTASFAVLKTTVQGCDSAQVIEDGHFTRNGVTSHFLVGLSWIREHGAWKVVIDQGTQLPA